MYKLDVAVFLIIIILQSANEQKKILPLEIKRCNWHMKKRAMCYLGFQSLAITFLSLGRHMSVPLYNRLYFSFSGDSDSLPTSQWFEPAKN